MLLQNFYFKSKIILIVHRYKLLLQYQKGGDNNMKKLTSILVTFAFAAVLSFAVAGSAYANDDHDSGYKYSKNRGYGGYGGYGYGGSQFAVVPSIDYLKSAFMQNFSYSNDVNYANRTNLAYTSSQASESYAHGFGIGGNHSSGHYTDFGVSSLFSLLSGLFDGRLGASFSMMF